MNKTKQHTRHVVPITFMLAILLVATACDQSSLPSASEEANFNHEISAFTAGQENARVNGQVAAQLAEVRRITAPYHDQQKAADKWSMILSPCVEHEEFGGMGYHYGNPAYLGNGILDPLKPEVLLYEPQKNGRLRLVGIEYIQFFGAPATEYDDPVKGDRPFLFGQGFDDSPHVGPHGAWTLHVWLWRNNPAGMFAPFNPKVNCDYAQKEN